MQKESHHTTNTPLVLICCQLDSGPKRAEESGCKDDSEVPVSTSESWRSLHEARNFMYVAGWNKGFSLAVDCSSLSAKGKERELFECIVEPLLMKDWCAIMDWSPNIDHKGDYLQLWNNHHLDKAVAQSQLFINECRRALGLSMKFWVAEIHEIVKNTILHLSELRVKCGDLNDALKQLDLTATPHKIKSTPSKRRSFIDLLELRDKLMRTSTEHKKNGSHVSVASEDAQAQAMVASFCGRSFDDCETDEIAQRIRRATANISVEIETLMEFLTHKGAIS
ncbi:hypothetical protein GCK32_001154 [Trichostrongylus colubriformis]|uniref:Uncharacterized protein n=1 Tax=Trichostrongylus colubriformis TaxID=6319 RepID=A0AAN8FFL7_TRICO